MVEIWKPIPDFPGYEASNLGRVQSFKKNQSGKWVIADQPQRILKPNWVGRYLRVVLCCSGVHYSRKVHRLVLESFVGQRPKGMVSCHNDCNPANNRLDNLRYDTPMGNAHDGVGEHITTRLTNRKATQVRCLAAQGLSDKELAKRFGVSEATIVRCRTGSSYSYVQGPLTSHLRKLTDGEVRQMREMASERDVSIAALAQRFDVTQSHVSLLLRGLRRQEAGGPILAPRYAKAQCVAGQ